MKHLQRRQDGLKIRLRPGPQRRQKLRRSRQRPAGSTRLTSEERRLVRAASQGDQEHLRSTPVVQPRSRQAARRPLGTSHLDLLALPKSEVELYQFLRRTKAAYSSLSIDWLASFHAHPQFTSLVSSRTYRFLLRAAFGASDLKLVRGLIADIKERGVLMDEMTKRAVLRGYAGMGPRLRSEDEGIRTGLLEELGRYGAGTVRPTGRRNFGVTGKGLNDLDELWKGWAVRGRDCRLRDQLDGLLLGEATPSDQLAVRPTAKGAYTSSPRARANLRPGSTSSASTPMKRIALSHPPVLIPPFAPSMPGSDVAGLVQALVDERRKAEAFDIAESWLAANRPVLDTPATRKPPDPPPSDSTPSTTPPSVLAADGNTIASGSFRCRVATYHSTAVVLLNILLKPLFLERAPLSVIRSFVSSFVAMHSVGPPAPPLMPDLVTLRTLVSGVFGTSTAWDRATSLVDWFGYQWGMPVADPCATGRLHFLPPSEVEANRLAVAPPSASTGSARVALELVRSGTPATTVRQTDLQLFLVRPHAVVPPDIALLLLRHAADQYSRGLFAQSANRRKVWRQGIRAWWRALEKDEAATDIWTGQKARKVLRRAVKVGLFKPKELERLAGGGRPAGVEGRSEDP
ncbi:hypothetical protein JCM8202v2_000731 [Rhodotorula sphaerocarpa]